jgi:hypothetical protein
MLVIVQEPGLGPQPSTYYTQLCWHTHHYNLNKRPAVRIRYNLGQVQFTVNMYEPTLQICGHIEDVHIKVQKPFSSALSPF